MIVLPGVFIVVRLDERGFTRQTKEVWDLEAPFDPRFRDVMLDTTEHLVNCGLSVVYGYTQSDEISLLLHRDAANFGRMACFDARISQLASDALVRDYFNWRHEDAHRNALSSHCYWVLRKEGKSAQSANHELLGLSGSQKNEFLFQNGINFNDMPTWQKRGCAVYWEDYQKPAINQKTGEPVPASS